MKLYDEAVISTRAHQEVLTALADPSVQVAAYDFFTEICVWSTLYVPPEVSRRVSPGGCCIYFAEEPRRQLYALLASRRRQFFLLTLRRGRLPADLDPLEHLAIEILKAGPWR